MSLEYSVLCLYYMFPECPYAPHISLGIFVRFLVFLFTVPALSKLVKNI